MPIDLQALPPSYMSGIIKYKINQYGIDKLLFMTDLYAKNCQEMNSEFVLAKWDEFSSSADQYIDTIKGTFADTENYYTIKQRRLFND